MPTAIPAIQFGYLTLTNYDPDSDLEEDKVPFLVKANKIVGITKLIGPDNDFYSAIHTNSDVFYVWESIEYIIEKLEGVHPSLR